MTIKIEPLGKNADGSWILDDFGQIKKKIEWTADHPGHASTMVDEVGADGAPTGKKVEQGDGCGVLLVTAPFVKGPVTLADGTTYNLTPEAVEYLPGHGGELAHHAELQIEASGQMRVLVRYEEQPDGTTKGVNLADADGVGQPFTHVCTDACGPAKDPARLALHQPVAAGAPPAQ